MALLAVFVLLKGIRERKGDVSAPETDVARPTARATSAAATVAGAATPAPARTGDLAPTMLPPEAREQLRVLDEILRARNDNDPRLDRELRDWSEPAREALRTRYAALAPEDRNGRGTIVFLLGRELHTERDVEFLKEVIEEKPCLSLTDCARDSAAAHPEDSHHEAGVEVTLSYPQLVALRALEKFLSVKEGFDPKMREGAWAAIRAAKRSGVPPLVRKASEAEQRLTRGAQAASGERRS